jgi:hypothetical protein
VEARSETDGSERRIDSNVTHWAILVTIGGNDDVNVLNDALEAQVRTRFVYNNSLENLECLEEILLLELELKKGTIKLVHEKHWLDALGDGLTKHGLGLHADTRDAVNDDEGTVSHTESGCHLRREVNVSGGINEVNKESISIDFLLDVGKIICAQLVVQGNGCGLDGNATLLLVLYAIYYANDTYSGWKTVPYEYP